MIEFSVNQAQMSLEVIYCKEKLLYIYLLVAHGYDNLINGLKLNVSLILNVKFSVSLSITFCTATNKPDTVPKFNVLYLFKKGFKFTINSVAYIIKKSLERVRSFRFFLRDLLFVCFFSGNIAKFISQDYTIYPRNNYPKVIIFIQ